MSSEHVEVRNLKFDMDSGSIPKFWHPRGKGVTVFFDALSTLFPLGERFFITSVRAHQDVVKDEGQKAEVRAFCSQEGIHTREHIRYNEMLKANGYPVDALETRLGKLLGKLQENLPDRIQLSVTCALEHFTALLAHFALGNGDALQGAEPNMAAIWRWHAAEESEHKAVAYDVYKLAYGFYPERAVVMMLATVIFIYKIADHLVHMFRAAGILFNVKEWAKLGWFLFGAPAVIPKITIPYLRYYIPGFHPNDMPCDDLLAEWKKDYASNGAYHELGANGAARPVAAVA